MSSDGFIDLSSITGMPHLRSKTCGGIPDTSTELRNSTGNCTACSSPTTELIAVYVCVCVGSFDLTDTVIMSCKNSSLH